VCIHWAVAQVTVDVAAIDRGRILRSADALLTQSPVTVTAFPAPRSAGGLHDFFSEGDYWWPDSTNPKGPYIQRDGQSNPNNFLKHREVMFAFARAVATLTAAHVVTGDRRYSQKALEHLRAWFVDEKTRMSPHLLYAQAIQGRFTGRGTGIIDTIHLIEVARSIELLSRDPDTATVQGAKRWFRDYTDWLTHHKYGIDERDAKNNHGTWWVAQVSAFARLIGDQALMDSCRVRYRTILLPTQMDSGGAFPLELRRTKPYNYSLFNLEGMALICQVLSTPEDNLWKYSDAAGRGMRNGVAFLVPYIVDKSKWPYPKDVQHFDLFPVRSSFLVFAGLAFNNAHYVDVWKSLDPDPTDYEVLRNSPLRQPVLWTTNDIRKMK
jgi:hypothetical protein